jgi:hypothetical protein
LVSAATRRPGRSDVDQLVSEIAIPTSDQQAPASCILTLAADPAVATMISADQPTVVVMKSCQELCANEFSGDH